VLTMTCRPQHLKSFHNAATVEVTSDREYFTKRGLHLNRRAKKRLQKQLLAL
jgi:hypothetical protein